MATECTGDILRLGRDPTKPQRMVRLLKRQQGRCQLCGLRSGIEDVLDAEGASLGWRPDQATGTPTWGCSTRIATIKSTVRVSMTMTRVLRSRVNLTVSRTVLEWQWGRRLPHCRVAGRR